MGSKGSVVIATEEREVLAAREIMHESESRDRYARTIHEDEDVAHILGTRSIFQFFLFSPRFLTADVQIADGR